jgi:galactokinase
MKLACQGEITTPSRCGRMDQGCAFGDRAVLMKFDGDRLNTEEVRPAKKLHFVIVGLKAGKNTLEILKRLNRSYPTAEGPLERGVQHLPGPINKRILGEARAAMEAGDGERPRTRLRAAERRPTSGTNRSAGLPSPNSRRNPPRTTLAAT